MIEELPATSRYQQALSLDRDAAERQLRMLNSPNGKSQEAPEWSPPLTEWNTTTAILAEIRDINTDLVQAVLASIPRGKGKSAPKYSRAPFPRPRTALDDLQDERALMVGRALVTLFFSRDGGGHS